MKKLLLNYMTAGMLFGVVGCQNILNSNNCEKCKQDPCVFNINESAPTTMLLTLNEAQFMSIESNVLSAHAIENNIPIENELISMQSVEDRLESVKYRLGSMQEEANALYKEDCDGNYRSMQLGYEELIAGKAIAMLRRRNLQKNINAVKTPSQYRDFAKKLLEINRIIYLLGSAEILNQIQPIVNDVYLNEFVPFSSFIENEEDRIMINNGLRFCKTVEYFIFSIDELMKIKNLLSVNYDIKSIREYLDYCILKKSTLSPKDLDFYKYSILEKICINNFSYKVDVAINSNQMKTENEIELCKCSNSSIFPHYNDVHDFVHKFAIGLKENAEGCSSNSLDNSIVFELDDNKIFIDSDGGFKLPELPNTMKACWLQGFYTNFILESSRLIETNNYLELKNNIEAMKTLAISSLTLFSHKYSNTSYESDFHLHSIIFMMITLKEKKAEILTEINRLEEDQIECYNKNKENCFIIYPHLYYRAFSFSEDKSRCEFKKSSYLNWLDRNTYQAILNLGLIEKYEIDRSEIINIIEDFASFSEESKPKKYLKYRCDFTRIILYLKTACFFNEMDLDLGIDQIVPKENIIEYNQMIDILQKQKVKFSDFNSKVDKARENLKTIETEVRLVKRRINTNIEINEEYLNLPDYQLDIAKLEGLTTSLQPIKKEYIEEFRILKLENNLSVSLDIKPNKSFIFFEKNIEFLKSILYSLYLPYYDVPDKYLKHHTLELSSKNFSFSEVMNIAKILNLTFGKNSHTYNRGIEIRTKSIEPNLYKSLDFYEINIK